MWFVVAGPEIGVSAQDARARLERIVRGLDLTERGSRRWLSALTHGLDQPQQERILAVTSGGVVVDSLFGQAGHVVLPLAFDARLLQPGANLVLVHNHPNGTGLSCDDLLKLSKPGVAAVVALGHDGSLYVAIAGSAYDVSSFEERQYAKAQDRLTRQLTAHQASGLPAAVAAEHRAHLTSLVLARAKVIEYRATLSSMRRESFERNRLALNEAIVFAAGRLKTD
jgi:hypothetical protein